ncbi:MAG: hypothetical protein WC631_03085 [Candidatus Paceibacterota bacterium]|jgi:ActR/RegA family two-component response regulator
MKKVLFIDEDKFYSGFMFKRVFKVRAPQIEYFTSVDISTDLLQEIKKIKPDVIVVALENEDQVESGMKIIKAIRQVEEIKNTIIAAFINSWANDHSPEALKDLGVIELWDKIDMMPKEVVEKIVAI